MTPQMKPSGTKEHLELTLTERAESADPSIPEKMLADLREALPGLLTELASSGSRGFRGKSEQELARAKVILSEAIERIGRLVLADKDQAHRHRMEREAQRIALLTKENDLYLSALERAVKVVKDLAAQGIDVSIRAVISGLPSQADRSGPALGSDQQLGAEESKGPAG